MSERDTELVAIPRPTALGSAVLRASRLAEQAAGSVLGPVEQVASRLAADIAEAVVAQIDVDAIIRRIDVDAIVQKVDVEAIVRRVDVDALVQRVDIDKILARTDLTPVVERVLDDVDIGSIVVESTGSITGGVVDSVRVQAIVADALVFRLVDFLLFRTWRRKRRDR